MPVDNRATTADLLAAIAEFDPTADAELTALAALVSAANKLPYFTGSGTAALTDLSAFARTLLDDADAATARATLGVTTGGGGLSYTDHGNAGATEDIAFTPASEHHHRLVLDANCTITFSGATAGVAAAVEVEVIQDATGSRTITWPASVKWPNGQAQPITATANGRDRLRFVTRDGGTTIDGITVAVAFG